MSYPRVRLIIDLPCEEFQVDLTPPLGLTMVENPARVALDVLNTADADARRWLSARAGGGPQ